MWGWIEKRNTNLMKKVYDSRERKELLPAKTFPILFNSNAQIYTVSKWREKVQEQGRNFPSFLRYLTVLNIKFFLPFFVFNEFPLVGIRNLSKLFIFQLCGYFSESFHFVTQWGEFSTKKKEVDQWTKRRFKCGFSSILLILRNFEFSESSSSSSNDEEIVEKFV